MKKAFDALNHYILKKKLYRYGINGNVLILTKSLITERKYQVRVNSKFASAYTISKGVPQISVLSPIIFLIYSIDIFKISQNMSTIIFADNATLIFRNKSLENLIISNNNESIKYREQTIANRLSLNLNKTHVMIFPTKPVPYQLQVAYHQQFLNIKEECTFLGVTSNNKLEFNKHIQIK